jgi:hypothetical protein
MNNNMFYNHSSSAVASTASTSSSSLYFFNVRESTPFKKLIIFSVVISAEFPGKTYFVLSPPLIYTIGIEVGVILM